ncbi:MAG TPA: hypothetical protein VD996_04015, partial [Chitinophagaceae bacterium]|nr:hypothetical protein [Chitinophagaceae bacterium]
MKSALILCCMLICAMPLLHAQEKIRPLESASGSKDVFTLSARFNDVLHSAPGDVLLELPDIEGGTLTAEVKRKDDFSPNYAARNSEGKAVSFEQPVCYMGTVQGKPHSSVLLLSRNNYLFAVVFKDDRAYVLSQKQAGVYGFEDMSDAVMENCATPDNLSAAKKVIQSLDPLKEGDETTDNLKCAGVYFEMGYDVYTYFQNSDANVLNYLNETFAVVSLLYAREGVPLKISETFIWHTPDPYQGLYYIDALVLFTQNRPVVNGQFGHLMKMNGSVTGPIEGVAWLNADMTFCSSSIQRAYSDLRPFVNPFPQYT